KVGNQNPKRPEARIRQGQCPLVSSAFQASAFGFLSDYGPSDFGFRVANRSFTIRRARPSHLAASMRTNIRQTRRVKSLAYKRPSANAIGPQDSCPFNT